MKQTSIIGNMMRNKNETYSLKSLAYKVLERNSIRNKSETSNNNFVSPINNHETNIDIAYYQDLYQERAAILEYDAELPRHEAEYIAYKEILDDYITEHYPSIKAEIESIIYQPTVN